jgi:hypothetical protein
MTTSAATAVLSAANEFTGTAAEQIGAAGVAARIAAATAAGAHNFIAELPEGYDTPLGRDGITLTAAQALRLTIARLLADDPPVVVLEDPTHGLDEVGEAAVLPGLEVLVRGRQVVLNSVSPAVADVAAHAGRPRGDALAVPRGPRLAAVPGITWTLSDPGLPQLTRLLSPVHMAPLLGRDASCPCIPDVRVQSVRYKPGANMVVQYAVATGDGWSTAVTYSAAGGDMAAKVARRRDRAAARAATRGPATSRPVGYLPDVDALVQWLPLDVRLPLLRWSSDKLDDRLVQIGLPSAGDAEPELLRYWARRRAVVGFGPYILKSYREADDYRDADRGLQATAQLRKVRSPAREGALPGRLTTVQRRSTGHSVSLRPAGSEPAGALLAELHTESVTGLRTTTPADILAKTAARAGLIGALLPGLRVRLDALLSRLEAAVPFGLALATSHGNYHAGQLLGDRDGLVLLDVDRLCQAAPAYDLASFAAHLAFGRRDDMERVMTTLDSLVAGYGRRPAGLEWFSSTCLLRRAVVPFRSQDEYWPDAVAQMVAAAGEALG